MLTSRGLGRVLGDLASMGFDARWGVLGAADVGANHQRDRIWIVAKWRGQLPHAQHNRIRWWEQQQKSLKKEERRSQISNTNGIRLDESKTEWNKSSERQICQNQLDYGCEVWSETVGCNQSGHEKEMANPASLRQQGQGQHEQLSSSKTSSDRQANFIKPIGSSDFWTTEPNVGRVADGVAARVDRLKAIGNGQVPLCAATAWRILSESL